MIWLDTSSDGASPWRIRYTVKSPGKILLVVKNRVFRFFSLKSPYFREFLAVRADVPTRPASNHPLLTKTNSDPYLFSIPVCKNSQKTRFFDIQPEFWPSSRIRMVPKPTYLSSASSKMVGYQFLCKSEGKNSDIFLTERAADIFQFSWDKKTFSTNKVGFGWNLARTSGLRSDWRIRRIFLKNRKFGPQCGR